MRNVFIFLMILLVSCNNEADKTGAEPKPDSLDAATSPFPLEEMSKDSAGTFLIWYVNSDRKTKKKNPAYDAETPGTDMIIRLLNQKYQNIRLDKLRQSGDTLYTEIRNSEYLGQKMGSFGATAYIADVVINLTAPPDINYINISMNAGSHISPGVWGEKEFADFKAE